jgi:hypothetical protein
MHVAMPMPDDRYFHNPKVDSTDSGMLVAEGSPGGYQSVIEADVNQQYGDIKFNGMENEEATFLPALRIVLYNPEDGNPGLNRHIVDLAGTQTDAQLGISALNLGGNATGADVAQAAVDAGIPAGAPLPGTSNFVPGDLGGSGGPGGGGLTDVANGISGLVARVFDGMKWLFRNPWEALQLGGTVLLLALPYLLMDRRRIWVREIFAPV